jgi:DNA-directed RNA polymerase subunit E"
MAKKKACKKCKVFVTGDKCAICGSSNFTTSWQGRLYIADAEKSMIADKIHVSAKGEYAIKVR